MLKGLLIATFVLFGLAHSIANIFNVKEGFYFDFIYAIGDLLLAVLVVNSVISNRKLSIIYKYLAVAILIFVFWNTLFYYVYILVGEIDTRFIVLEILSYLAFIIYGIWKARLYKTEK